MNAKLRIGIIGANAHSGWARDAHVPAATGIDGLTLTAVATSRQESADEAAHAFGADRAYASGLALIADPEIDVVTIATRVPDHRELVLAAIAAGKHVYSEWPLGRSSAESAEMARAALGKTVHHAIGLQLRASPTVRLARELVAQGAIGRLLSVSTFSSTAGFGPEVPAPYVYLEDPDNFANLVTIQGAHTLDLLEALGSGLTTIASLMSRQFPDIRVGNDRTQRRRETFDHLLVQGRLTAGIPFTLEVAGGRSDAPFQLDLVGTKGTLRLDGGSPRGLQASRIGLLRDGERQPIDEGELTSLPDAAVNVGGVYAALRDDIGSGMYRITGFDHAERLSVMMENILAAREWASHGDRP